MSQISTEKSVASTKECSVCKLSLPIENFYNQRKQCKSCILQAKRCEHDKIKQYCEDCGGVSLCSHGKQKRKCIECGELKHLCEHKKVKHLCSKCEGTGLCEHKKERSICVDCKGSAVCIHDKVKYSCKDCKGSAYCSHGKKKQYCRDCSPQTYCIEHGKEIRYCKQCKGKGLCIHDVNKSDCKKCSLETSKRFCEHKKKKKECPLCDPRCACIICKAIFVTKKTQFYPQCQSCFCVLHPDHELSTLFKIKERYMRDELRTRLPEEVINMRIDTTIDGGCSTRRPDILIDKLMYSIIIECDEEQHKNYECENKRTMQLFQDLGSRPLIIIRFNPDSYVDEGESKVQGCFKPCITENEQYKKRFYDLNEDEWKKRINILESVLREKLQEVSFPNKELEVIHLFYDKK